MTPNFDGDDDWCAFDGREWHRKGTDSECPYCAPKKAPPPIGGPSEERDTK